MPDFVINKLPYDLSSHAGLALVIKRVLVESRYKTRYSILNSLQAHQKENACYYLQPR